MPKISSGGHKIYAKKSGEHSLVSRLSMGLGAATVAAVFGVATSCDSHAANSNNASVTTSVTVLSSCNITADGSSKTSTFLPGTFSQIGGDTTLTISCNDPNGYGIYAVGASGTADEEGNTNLVGSKSNIPTGTATSGDTSAWNMKLSSPSSGLTIASGFSANHTIPATRTLVASRSAGTSAVSGDNVKVSYSAYVSKTQTADTYTGKVKYILFYPSTNTSRTMQTFSCSSLKENQITTLIDTRDNNPYTVAKLKDGKCWMVENLRLGKKGGTMTLKSTDSDVTADFVLPVSALANFTGTNNKAAYIDATYGGIYSWFTATAGTGTAAVTTGEATGSICPKGWKLPTGAEYGAMFAKYGSVSNATAWSSALRATPIPGFVFSGGASESGAQAKGSGGYYWSSTAAGAENAKDASMTNSTVAAPGSFYKYMGRAVRCVSRN